MANMAGRAMKNLQVADSKSVSSLRIHIGRTEKSVYMLRANQVFPCVECDTKVMFDIADLDKWITNNKTVLPSQ